MDVWLFASEGGCSRWLGVGGFAEFVAILQELRDTETGLSRRKVEWNLRMLKQANARCCMGPVRGLGHRSQNVLLRCPVGTSDLAPLL